MEILTGNYSNTEYEVIVVGLGHAGCEAALACARMGRRTLALCQNLDSIALMACNPSIGGTSKGHLVREIDAMGGEMGLAADQCFIQMRMLNTGKGPAVHSLRAQIDKSHYHMRMKAALENQPKLTVLQDECAALLTHNGRIAGIRTAMGATYSCHAIIVACGVYLNSRIHVGEYNRFQGPCGLSNASLLSSSLSELGFKLRRFKTGTPPRVAGNSIDYSKMQPQYGDSPIPKFSFLTALQDRRQSPCYLTYTNPSTHSIIKANLSRSPMYSGAIDATGTRYCPSIEDKVVRFADRDRHQLFIEPEGLNTSEMYVQGFSTSLPRDVQYAMLRTVAGMENCVIMRYGYAIEYDCIDPTMLDATLMCKHIEGLYFAGQLNGSSGYEEAAAQGLYAGINAALALADKEKLILTRADAYIGVLCDDLTVKGTNEPYRMMTSRAEYRLQLRQDNADLRLTELARRTGLVSDARYSALCKKRENISRAIISLDRSVPADEALNALLLEKGEAPVAQAVRLSAILRRNNIGYCDLLRLYDFLPDVGKEAMEQLEVQSHYEGYIKKQEVQIAAFRKAESTLMPIDIDYMSISGLRIEARQKLNAIRPRNIGQASRISGVSPADIAVLLVKLKALNSMEENINGN